MSETYTITAGTHDWTVQTHPSSSTATTNTTLIAENRRDFPDTLTYQVIYVEIDTSSIQDTVIQEATLHWYTHAWSLAGTIDPHTNIQYWSGASEEWINVRVISTPAPTVGWEEYELNVNHINTTGLSKYRFFTGDSVVTEDDRRAWTLRAYENTTGGESQGYWSPYIEATLESGVVKKYILVRHVS